MAAEAPHDEDTCKCCREWLELEDLKLKHTVRGAFYLAEDETKATPIESIVAQIPYHVSIGCGCFTVRMQDPVDTAALRKAVGPDWIVRQTKSHSLQRIRESNRDTPVMFREPERVERDVVLYDVLLCKRVPLPRTYVWTAGHSRLV
jgi:hypothetical protein